MGACQVEASHMNKRFRGLRVVLPQLGNGEPQKWGTVVLSLVMLGDEDKQYLTSFTNAPSGPRDDKNLMLWNIYIQSEP
jgi:hypothetical protein